MTGKKFLSKGTVGLLVGLLLTLFAASGVLAAGATIEKFYAEPALVTDAETTFLNWKVSNASKIEIIGLDKETEALDPKEGRLEVWPQVTTSYVLIAYGNDGVVVSKSVTVNVDVKGDVSIDYFKASSTRIKQGETATLSWNAKNGVSVRIFGISEKDDECVRSTQGSIVVWPTETTTYLMEATGRNGEIVSAAVTVNVAEVQVKQPKILSFTASAKEVARGELVILNWTTENVVKCTLFVDKSALPNRPANGSIAVTPNKTKTYTLIAYGANNEEVKASITITVK